MRKIFPFLLIIMIFTTSSCALTGGNKTHYGTNVKVPDKVPSGYTPQCKSPVIPLPDSSFPEIPVEDLQKSYSISYLDLFTISLRALRYLNYQVISFNSDTGLIDFTSSQGETLTIKLYVDMNSSKNTEIKIFSPSGTRKICRSTIDNIFKAIRDELK